MAVRFIKRIFRQFRSNIITGIFLIIPLFVTVLIIIQLFQWIDSALPRILGIQMAPGLGILITIVIAYFAGLAAKNYFGKKMIEAGNTVIANIPILNKIYLTIQQVVDMVSMNKSQVFERAVFVEFPQKNSYVIGFVTNRATEKFSLKVGEKLVAVFVPTTPNPTSGYLLYVSEAEIVELNIPVETAVKLVVSGGLLSVDQSAKMQSTIPPSKKAWNWMDLFKKRNVKDLVSDPRD